MLALDSTIGCIEVSESEVVDLYRSAAITRNSSSNSRIESVEAYLCAIKKKPNQVKVYLALVVNDHKIYVYTSPGKGKSDEAYPKEVEEALECARAMGFSPERVDLSYSPAMREVVVRNTKMLRLPGSKGRSDLKHGLAGAPTLPLARTVAADLPETAPQAAPATVSAPSPAPPVTDAAASVTGTESAIDAPDRRKALAELEKERDALLDERDALESRLSQLCARHDELAAELCAVRESHARLTAERDALLPSRKQVDELLPAKDAELAELARQVAELGRQLESANGQHADMGREHGAMVENLAQARLEMAKLAAERESALEQARLATERHREASAQLEKLSRAVAKVTAENEEALLRVGALEEQNGILAAEVAGLRREAARVGSEKDEALNLVAALQDRMGPDQTELAELRGALNRLSAERDATLERVARLQEEKGPDQAALADLRQQLCRTKAERDDALERVALLEGELASAETESPERLGKPEGIGAERDAPPKRCVVQEDQRGTAEAETNPLRQEMEDSLAEQRLPGGLQEGMGIPTYAEPASMDAPLAQESEQLAPRVLQGLQDEALDERPAFEESDLPAYQDLQIPQREHAWDAPEPSKVEPSKTVADLPSMVDPASLFVSLGDLQGGFFSAADEGDQVRFMLETGLTTIEYGDPDEVLELHHSINNAYLSPEGTGGQESCQGYICCLRKAGSKQVFTAIYGTSSQRTSVYLPEQQPQDEDSYARSVRGAISFAEEVGLMMEPVPLDGSPEKREEQIKRCPALRMAKQK